MGKVADNILPTAFGTEFGIRGWIDATDLNTGKQVWRTYTIPRAGEPGNELRGSTPSPIVMG